MLVSCDLGVVFDVTYRKKYDLSGHYTPSKLSKVSCHKYIGKLYIRYLGLKYTHYYV